MLAQIPFDYELFDGNIITLGARRSDVAIWEAAVPRRLNMGVYEGCIAKTPCSIEAFLALFANVFLLTNLPSEIEDLDYKPFRTYELGSAYQFSARAVNLVSVQSVYI